MDNLPGNPQINTPTGNLQIPGPPPPPPPPLSQFQQPQNQFPSSSNTNPKTGGIKSILSYILAVFIALLFIMFIFGTLNYLNIISLSGLYPNIFGWLPITSTRIPQQTTGLSTQPTTCQEFTNTDEARATTNTECIILNISGQGLFDLPPEIQQLKNLQVLDLSNNQLSTFPKEIANISSLRSLKLAGNNFTEEEKKRIREEILPSALVVIEF